MKKLVMALVGLSLFLLPVAAGAQNFTASFVYTAKFLCGFLNGSENRLGVVVGHYNTIINAAATKNRVAVAYRATAVKNDIGITNGAPSDFSERFDLDRDHAFGILCADIKRGLFDQGGEGFVEGFVMIYSSAPLNVSDVVTGQGFESGVTAMQIYQVTERATSFAVRPRPVN